MKDNQDLEDKINVLKEELAAKSRGMSNLVEENRETKSKYESEVKRLNVEISRLNSELNVLSSLKDDSNSISSAAKKMREHENNLNNLENIWQNATEDVTREVKHHSDYVVGLAKESYNIIAASRHFETKMKWSLKKIKEASENVPGVKKFLATIASIDKPELEKKSFNSIYRIDAEDKRTIRFMPEVQFKKAGDIRAIVYLRKFGTLNNFVYRMLFAPERNKIVLSGEVSLTEDLDKKIHAGYVNHTELVFDIRKIQKVDAKVFDYFSKYNLADCQFKLLVDEKREKEDRLYGDTLYKFVNSGFLWERFGVEAMMPAIDLS